jgi:signal peptidase
MKETLEKISQNKPLKIMWNIIYTFLYIVVVLMLLVVVIQRASNNSVALGGYRIFNVATGSMVPVYEVGDVLVSQEIDPSQIKVGDDIVYLGEKGDFKNRVVTHRVISVWQEDGTYKIITKGVANDEADPEITSDQVYGKIVYKMQILSFISKTLIENIYVFYFAVFLPIALILFSILKKIFTKSDEDDDDEEDEEESEDQSKINSKNKRR